jgi:hypothetical protein
MKFLKVRHERGARRKNGIPSVFLKSRSKRMGILGSIRIARDLRAHRVRAVAAAIARARREGPTSWTKLRDVGTEERQKKQAAKAVVAGRFGRNAWKKDSQGLHTDVRLKPDPRRKKLAFTRVSPYDGKLAFF